MTTDTCRPDRHVIGPCGTRICHCLECGTKDVEIGWAHICQTCWNKYRDEGRVAS